MNNKAFIIMGVSGSGKTTVGKLLAEKTGYLFLDADNFHPKANVEKMRSGIPLNDDDRLPWLQNLNQQLIAELGNRSVFLACSALKNDYRNILADQIEQNCEFILLHNETYLIAERLKNRSGHYMPPTLLESQIDTLEIPANAFKPDIRNSPEEIVGEIMDYFKLF